MTSFTVFVILLGLMSTTAMNTDDTKQLVDTIIQEAVNNIHAEGDDAFRNAFNFQAEVKIPNNTFMARVTDTTFTGIGNLFYGGAYIGESFGNFFSMESNDWEAKGKLQLRSNDGKLYETEINFKPTYRGLRFSTDFKFNSNLKSIIVTGMSLFRGRWGDSELIMCTIPNCPIQDEEACKQLVHEIDQVLTPSGFFIRLLDIVTSLFQKHLPF